jgi:hypothetical protein
MSYLSMAMPKSISATLYANARRLLGVSCSRLLNRHGCGRDQSV